MEKITLINYDDIYRQKIKFLFPLVIIDEKVSWMNTNRITSGIKKKKESYSFINFVDKSSMSIFSTYFSR